MILKELIVELGIDVDESAFSRAEEVVHSFTAGVAALGAAAVGAAAAGIAYLTKEAADYGEEFYKLSQTTGIGVEQLQRLAFSAKMGDVEIGALTRSLAFMAKKGVKDLEGGLLDLADEFAKMPDGGAKLQLAQQRLGKGAKELIPWLNKGRDGIKEYIEQADEFGLVFSQEETEKANKFNDQIKLLNGAVKGLGLEIGKKFFDLLGGDAAIKAIVGIRKWVKGLSVDTNLLTQRIKAAAKMVAIFAGAALIAGIITGKIGLVALIQGFIATGAAAVGAAVRMSAAWLAAAWPVIALTVLIGGLFLLLEDFYQFVSGGDSLIGDMLGPNAVAVRDWFISMAGYVEKLMDLFPNLGDTVGRVWEIVKSLAVGVVKLFQGDFTGALAEGKNIAAQIAAQAQDALVRGIKVTGIGGAETLQAVQHFDPQSLTGTASPSIAQMKEGAIARQSAAQSTGVMAPVTINVTPGPGMNENMLAQAIGAQFDAHLRSAAPEAKK